MPRPRVKIYKGKLITSTNPFIRMIARGCDVQVQYVFSLLGHKILNKQIQIIP